jgi:hypothetical protein
MFKTNESHLQSDMFGATNQLSVQSQRRLEESWSGAFYRDFFCRIEESVFADLYSDQPSRPNVPVNLLIGFEVLKAGHGWSDEQAHDAVRFDLQVRHALGLHRLSDDVFTLRTVYNFRRAVANHAATTGENLFEVVFKQVTGEQQKVYEVGSTKLRMDSTQIASNMRNMSRLQLLVEVLQRVHRVLNEADRERLAEQFAPYTRGSSRKYAYHLRGDQPQAHLIGIGRVMAELLKELKAEYGDTSEYGMLKRVFGEHFFEGRSGLMPRSAENISAQSLQSPDDPEATYRQKRRRRYRGYVANLTETCDEANEVQLIVDVTVEPNSADDGQMLLDAADELAERTDVETLYTDGGYNGPKVDEALTEHGIELVQTGIRGRKSERLGREDFEWEVDEQQKPLAVTCPGGQRVDVERGRKSHTFLARFDNEACSRCPLRDECPTRPMKRRPVRVLRFTARQVQAARRVKRSRTQRESGSNPRSAVEATVWSATARFPRCRVPYRGQARVTMYTIASSAMVNVRRLAAMARQRAAGRAGEAPSRPFHATGAATRVLAALQRALERSAPFSARQTRFALIRVASP